MTEEFSQLPTAVPKPTIFDQLHPDSRYVSFTALAHGNFNGLEGMIPGVLGTEKVQSWSKGGEIARIGYETICKLALSFLDAKFTEDKSTGFDEKAALLKKALPSDFYFVTVPK